MKRRRFLSCFVGLPLIIRPVLLSRFDDIRIGYCGKDCSCCEIYRATKYQDNDQKKEIASRLSEKYKVLFSYTNISCYGCKVGRGVHLNHCNTCSSKACHQSDVFEPCVLACAIRRCASRKMISCADCEDKSCNKKKII